MKRSRFSSARSWYSIFDCQSSAHSSRPIVRRRSSSSRSVAKPVCETSRFFSCLCTAEISLATVSAVRLTASSRIETRSRRCSSSEKSLSRSPSKPSPSAAAAPEITISFW